MNPSITPPENEPSAVSVKFLTEEIKCILERNQNEKFLRKLLTRAIILEKLLRCTEGGDHT